MKKIIDRIDFLWKGDKDSLGIMWLSIMLAAVSIVSAVVNLYLVFN